MYSFLYGFTQPFTRSFFITLEFVEAYRISKDADVVNFGLGQNNPFSEFFSFSIDQNFTKALVSAAA